MAPLSSPAALEGFSLEDLNAFYRKVWGRPWPQSSDTIYKHEIVPNAMTIDNDNDNDDKDDGYGHGYSCLVDLDYHYFLDMMELATTFGLGDGLQADVLVILQEYLFLHKMIEMNDKENAIVLTGQPGTGKTSFLLYLLLHRLEKRLSTAVQFDNIRYVIFDEHGPTVHIIQDLKQLSRLRNCWALAGSNPDIIQPCQAFTCHAKLVIQATSLKRDRWHSWAKQTDALLIVSDLPKVMEIGAILKVCKLPTSSTLSLICKWGPSIRTIVSIIIKGKQKEKTLEHTVKVAAQTICNDPKSLRILTCGGRFNEGSDLAFVLPRREFAENGDILMSVTAVPSIPTKFLAGLFEETRSTLSNENSLELFELFSSHSFTRASGRGLEKRMHSSLAVCREPLKIFREDDVEHLSPSTTLLPGTLAGLKNAPVALSSFYWVPSVMNFPGIDAVLCNNG